jgi:hypothetical protein
MEDQMKLFQLTLPIEVHDERYAWPGVRATADERAALERFVCEEVGGFSKSSGHFGVWYDGEGKRYEDRNIVYQIACHPDTFRSILAKAFELFHFEKAILWAELGTATVEYRQIAEATE